MWLTSNGHFVLGDSVALHGSPFYYYAAIQLEKQMTGGSSPPFYNIKNL